MATAGRRGRLCLYFVEQSHGLILSSRPSAKHPTCNAGLPTGSQLAADASVVVVVESLGSVVVGDLAFVALRSALLFAGVVVVVVVAVVVDVPDAAFSAALRCLDLRVHGN